MTLYELCKNSKLRRISIFWFILEGRSKERNGKKSIMKGIQLGVFNLTVRSTDVHRSWRRSCPWSRHTGKMKQPVKLSVTWCVVKEFEASSASESESFGRDFRRLDHPSDSLLNTLTKSPSISLGNKSEKNPNSNVNVPFFLSIGISCNAF